MTQPVSANESDQVSQILGNEYYQKLQRDMKERRDAQEVVRQNPGEGDVVESQQRVAAVVRPEGAHKAGGSQAFNDSVSIRSFRWNRGSTGDFELSSQMEPSIPTAVDIKTRHVESVGAIGYKIDLNDRLGQLKQSLMQSVIQSRSSNFFVSKYAEFKVGMLVRLLGVMGVTPQELSAIQAQAIEDAVAENIQLMEENIYSSELAELVYGKGKKNRRTLQMFAEIQRQLMAQMAALGQKDYWTEQRIAEEQVRQVKRIRDEFQKERGSLAYQYDFYFKGIHG
jgi:hypothetical protein